jgi:hypothetical protein
MIVDRKSSVSLLLKAQSSEKRTYFHFLSKKEFAENPHRLFSSYVCFRFDKIDDDSDDQDIFFRLVNSKKDAETPRRQEELSHKFKVSCHDDDKNNIGHESRRKIC